MDSVKEYEPRAATTLNLKPRYGVLLILDSFRTWS